MRKDSPYYLPSINVLQSASLFYGVNKEMLEDILSYLTPMTLPKKSIISPWQTKESLFIIIKGRVKISQVNLQTGREYIISILEGGDVFDVITFLDNKEHEVIIETIDNVQLLKADMNIAREWLNAHPEFNKNFLPYIGRQIRKLEDAAVDLALYDTVSRLAKLIVRNLDSKQERQDYSVKLINDLSHETLAQMIGSVRKIVNLHIQAFKKEGIIDSKRGNILVKDIQKLLKKADTFLLKK